MQPHTSLDVQQHDSPPRLPIDPAEPSTWPAFLRTPDLATILRLNEHQARRLLHSRRLGKPLRLGRFMGVAKAALLRWLEGSK
jgi:hypothetical protein